MINGETTRNLLLMVFGFVMIIAGIVLAAGSKKAKYDEAARMSFNVVVSLIFVAIGLGAVSFTSFGKSVLQAVGINLG
ncbi:hypothetical protein CGZ94_20185 [Enemella evansiae]|uniref:Uncharacterized protein n=1 Tax=Enemella evansiae TaxID=2016499 RepID=A0A255FYP8_9ACTN|nr:hypothetical protein [Enemella evansiae]OYO08817.1 hypothetical protein CGZ94_20185 [Enemella evansiae]